METVKFGAGSPQYVSLGEAAAWLSLSRRSIERLVASGRIKVAKFARSTRVSIAELRRFAESCEVTRHDSHAA